MSKLQSLVLSTLITSSPLLAETVLITGSGTITSSNGVFQDNQIPIDNPISFRITYDDQATAGFSAAPLGIQITNYSQNINLNVSITSGPLTWTGSVDSAPITAPFTVASATSTTVPSNEVLSIRLGSDELATFPTFPFRSTGDPATLTLSLSGPAPSFLGSGISVDAVDLALVTTITGSIATSTGNDLQFQITPSSANILFEADENSALAAVVPFIETTSDLASLTWESDASVDYLIESTTDLSVSTWTPVLTVQGTGSSLSRSFPLSEERNFFRIVTQARP